VSEALDRRQAGPEDGSASDPRADADAENLEQECALWFVLAREAEEIQRTLAQLAASLPDVLANGS
jgi:hypothetical protein